jgi:hypothetical protein
MPGDIDVFMTVFDEPNAGANWARLKAVHPQARLVEGVRGIFEAYGTCAQWAKSPCFFMVDADNWILDGFRFTLDLEPAPDEVVFWYARNPVNGLAYAHGGIKLFQKALFDGATETRLGPDFSTTIGRQNRYVADCASEHRFNSDPYKTWSCAFREGSKLALATVIGTAEEKELSTLRLRAWCGELRNRHFNAKAAYRAWSERGAKDGGAFGRKYARDPKAFARINDYAWLRATYEKTFAGKTASGAG